MSEPNNNLLESLQKLRAQSGGKIAPQDIDEIMKRVADTIKDYTSGVDANLYKEMKHIAEQVYNLKVELATSAGGAEQDLPAASVQLEAVVKATEKAANEIMDCAEQIMQAGMKVTDPALNKAITEQAGKIFESCNFQDLTGQRIKKVLTILSELEVRLLPLMQSFIQGTSLQEIAENAKREKLEEADANLLSGPQLTKDAPSQDEVDKLFGG